MELGKLIILTPPADRPVAWADAKAHLRIDVDTEQSLVESMIDAAVDYAQESMDCSLMLQTIQQMFYAGEPLMLRRGPLASITSVTDGASASITDFDLEHAGRQARMIINQSFTYPVRVVFTAGRATAAEVDASIRIAIRQHVASMYAQRESVSERAVSVVPQSLADFYARKSRATGIA
jgi:uncharacterized phiE125 gp8 family phage protein